MSQEIKNIKEWFYTNDKGEKELVIMERWIWAVIYKDGTELHQFDKNGVFHRIGEIEQDKVKAFVLYKSDGSGKRIDILIPDGGSIIHKYRNYRLNVGTPNEKKIRICIFGYKKGRQKHFNFILPDDMIVQATEDNSPLSGMVK